MFAILTAWILSYTRNAWVGGFAGLITLGLLKGKRMVIWVGLATIFVVVLMSILQPTFGQRIKSIFDPTYYSNNQRINMAKISIEMFREAPFLGVGEGNYPRASEPFREKYSVTSKSHPHNNLLAQLAGKGLLGLGAYIYMWYIIYKECWLTWRYARDDLSRAISAGGLAALIGFNVAGLFEGNFGDSEVAMMMWLMVGLCMWARGGVSRISHAPLSKPV